MSADVGPLGDLLPEVFRAIDLTGVFLNGVLGGTIARRRQFDIVGFGVLAIVSALGGGLLRDTLLQAGPPVALTDGAYLAVALVGAVVAFVVRLEGRWWNRTFILADAVVLGAWSATGTTKALAAGLGLLPAVLLGVTTAVGGGIIRDVVVGQVPAVFGGNTLYATPAILASLTMAGLAAQGQETAGMLAAIAVGAGLGVLARWRRWVLPHADAMRLPGLRRHPNGVARLRPDSAGVHPLRPRRPRVRRRVPGEHG